MKKIFISTSILILQLSVTAQKFYTKNGSVSFFSKAPLENISAENNQVTSILSAPAGEIQFSVLVRAFHFKKSLMEEHFNESYMESSKFPKAVFKGRITDPTKINFTADGNYTVEVTGDMTIHGVTHKITTPATITIKSGIPVAAANFKIKVADYKIAIPKIVKDNISEVVDVTVSCVYDQKL